MNNDKRNEGLGKPPDVPPHAGKPSETPPPHAGRPGEGPPAGRPPVDRVPTRPSFGQDN